jgi:RNA polymerase sigma-70 factor (ECF subfamily)
VDKARETDLAARAKAGDQAAFGELVKRSSEHVRHLIARLVGDRADVDDVLQTVFLEAYRSLPGFDGRSLFSTWLHRIAMRVSAHALSGAPLAAVEVEESRVVEAPTVASAPMSPEAAADAHEGTDRLEELMSELPPTQQSAFVLHEMEERSVKSVANALGTTTAAVKVRIFKARQALHKRARADTWFRQTRTRPTPVR